MTKQEIRKKLKEFEKEIFLGHLTIAEAKELDRRLDVFIAENNLTADDLDEFAESGAGEMLSMLIS